MSKLQQHLEQSIADYQRLYAEEQVRGKKAELKKALKAEEHLLVVTKRVDQLIAAEEAS